jgi:hypothetical protein
VDDVGGIQGVEALALRQVPQHGHTVLLGSEQGKGDKRR